MPPPLVVMILLPLKDKIPITPNAPADFSPYVAPSASAASSITGTLYREHISRIGRTSVTVDVEMHAELPLTGERFLATKGQFVMVALDDAGHPTSAKR